jgi:hypothetical protein
MGMCFLSTVVISNHDEMCFIFQTVVVFTTQVSQVPLLLGVKGTRGCFKKEGLCFSLQKLDEQGAIASTVW